MSDTLTEAYYRRLYAFHKPSPVIPIEEFYSPSEPRDQKGKWTRSGGGSKVWSGVSADPDNRVRPKSKIHFPLEPEGYETPAEARAMLATRIYDADLGNGYQSRVLGVKPITNGISVVIKIRKGNKEVAEASRELTIDGAGYLIANHETLYVDAAHQNKGIADRFNAHAIAEYQKIGVDRIGLNAGDTVGGYAWARQGFRIFEGDRKKFLNAQLDRVGSELRKPVVKPHEKKLKADVEVLRKAIAAGEDVQPIHIASLGEKYARYEGRDDHGNTYTTWPGKSLLIGTHWLGQYYFDAAHPITAAATDLAHVQLRPAFRQAVERFRKAGIEELACHDATCAPPPAGTGGSSAGYARRGAVPGYGPARRRDVHLGGVRVTYKPDYPDDHPDPGEIVWAKVRYQENTALSKDRPVLVIGRINGTDKLAAVQLTSQIKGRSDEHVIGTGPWDRLGRTGAAKLSQIIVIDPKDYRREGGTIDRDTFESVIGKLAAFHRTPVQIAAAAYLALDISNVEENNEHVHLSGGIEFACHDKSCAPPPVGVGGSSPGPDIQMLGRPHFTTHFHHGETWHHSWDEKGNSAGMSTSRENAQRFVKGRETTLKRVATQAKQRAANRTFKVITATQARGDSRPVSHDEFQRLARVGQSQLDEFARLKSPHTGLDEHWSKIKSESYAEVVKPWGGATIDSHTGKALPQGANAYAITVKSGQQTVSVHEHATEVEFSSAMDKAKKQFSTILQRQSHYLGVFHDDENHRIDIDPVLVVTKRSDVDTIGAASHSIGGAYNFSDGNGYWPPHVAEGA